MVQICLIKVQRLNKYEMGIKIGHVIVLEKLAPQTRWHELCKTPIPAHTRVPEFKLAHLWPSPLYILPRPSPSTLYLLPFLLTPIYSGHISPSTIMRKVTAGNCIFMKFNEIQCIRSDQFNLLYFNFQIRLLHILFPLQFN